MTIDANGLYGRFGAFARGIWDLDRYLEELRRHGIDRSLVSSAESVLHDVRRGNDLIFKLSLQKKDELIPVAVANPRWPVKEVEECLARGSRAIRLCPATHHFDLSNPWLMNDFMSFCSAVKVPLIIDVGLSPCRSVYGIVPTAEAMAFCNRYADLNFLLMNIPGSECAGLTNFLKTHPRVFLENSDLYMARYVEHLVAAGLENQICLGTGFGINSMAAGISTIRCAEVTAQQKRKMMGENIGRFLGLPMRPESRERVNA
ncbi:MAG: amidohydrolase family protein [Verrucomicrobia bacterium]|nr:amidohydrolase family protein [Verrucomicrobiota bacterium]MBU1736364.1 amidohydrolase family protein [Verrucomicrobiota bacterium]MBU1858143.1 amidohydrolase family protein [Verrucomicrobiota bacterium]